MSGSLHTLWQDLAAAALVGVERSGLQMPAIGGKLGVVLAGLANHGSGPDHTLLATAGVVALYRRAGAKPVTDESSLPEPCPADARPMCEPRAGHRLALMLGGQHREVLPEWLDALARSERRIRDEDLVPLLEYGRGNRARREAIMAVIGNRGRWLAAQNPEWKYASGWDDEAGKTDEDWQTGGREWRLERFRQWRASDPTKARELLAASWDQESPTDRPAFLEAFSIGLSMKDEPFLESALDDKRAEARRAAVELLSKLAPSRLCERMTARIEPLVQLTESKGTVRFDLNLPDQYTKDMARDGISRKLPGMGERNAWLNQMIATVPPSYWCRRSGRSPAELLKAAEASDWKLALCWGWAEAAGRHHDEDWLEACLEASLSAFSRDNDLSIFHKVVAGLSGERLDSMLTRCLHRYPESADAVLRALTQATTRSWGTELSRTVLDVILSRLRSGDRSADYLALPMLQVIGPCIPLSLRDELSELFSITDPSWPPYKLKAINDFLDLLQFRHEMLTELQQS